MAIPVGSTSRQLEWLARWVLAGAVILGTLTWWWPGYAGWGSTAVAMLVVLTVWLLWRTVSARRTVPGHPVHLVLLGPCLILIFHLVRTGLADGDAWSVSGALNVSMIFQLALLALGVMLSQSLLPHAARHVAVLGVCAAAMMGGPAAAMLWGPSQPLRTPLALVGFAGAGVWLTMLWGIAPPDDPPQAARRHRALRIACVVVAAAAACGLAVVAPLPALLMVAVVGAAMFLAGLVFPRRRGLLLAGGGVLAAAALIVLSAVHWVRGAVAAILADAGQAGWLGSGEEAFRRVSGGDSGLAVLAATTGWAGAAWFLVGLAACMGWLLVHARRGHPGDRARAVVWTAASGAVGAALLAPGGLFTPAIVLAAAFVWGLLPAMLGRRERPRSGAYLLAAVVVVGLCAGLSRQSGLLGWSLAVFGGRDALPHAIVGFLVAMLLAWLLGARRAGLGLLGIAAAALAGGAGELLQYAAATRTADLSDWLCHVLGSAAAVLPYLLCVGARWCESPDARPLRPEAAEAYLGPPGSPPLGSSGN